MSRINVKALRSGVGMSLTQFARELGVGRRTIMRWENDGVDPSPLAIAQLKRFQSQMGNNGRSGTTVKTPSPSLTPKRRQYEPDPAPAARQNTQATRDAEPPPSPPSSLRLGSVLPSSAGRP